MAIQRITDELLIPIPLDEAWDFFTNPRNLAQLTPKEMNFRHVFEPDEERVYKGMYLVYKVSPLAGIPLTWVTEITEVLPKKRFVDDQIKGPFARWHHIHEFEDRGDKTLIRDVLYYQMPLGFLGDIAHSLFAKKQVAQIFTFRKERMEEIFGK